MTRRAWKPCGKPGCRALVRGGFCREHARSTDQARGTAFERGYDKVHVAFRAVNIGNSCEKCGVDQADSEWPLELDHIDGLGPKGPRGLDPENAQTLCKPCHSAKTRAGAHR